MSKNESRKKRSSSPVLVIIFIICLAVAAFAAYKLISLALEYKAGEDEYAQLQQYTRPESVQPTLEESDADASEATQKDKPGAGTGIKPPITVDFEALKAINPDCVAWIYLAAEDISYPIVHTTDNEYYLHRTFERADNFAGTLFVECLNDPDFNSPNTIIYGHNMKNGSMFGRLKFLQEEENYKKDGYFWILTPEGAYKYKIFNIEVVNENSELYTIFTGPCPEVVDYINRRASESSIQVDIGEITQDSKVVTLSTCAAADSPERLVVQGIRVEG